jgi:osmotically-inducible protein OsmY
MGSQMTFLAGVGVGAGLMYMLDPDRGNRRRALVRDQIVSARHRADDRVTGLAKDVQNRAKGTVAETVARIREDEVSDEVLVERVRSEMGRATSHPRAIEVRAHDGQVTLSGSVLRREVDTLLSTVASVRGVRNVENQLQIQDQPGSNPSLQQH